MRIPVHKRSEEVMEKVEKEIEKYRLKAHRLMEKDKKRMFLRKSKAHELDDTFGQIESHPSLFGTQPGIESSKDSEESSRTSGESGTESETSDEYETEESDDEMDDVESLSQGLSQISTTKAGRKPERPKQRGDYKRGSALNSPKLKRRAKVKRMMKIKKKIQAIADHEGVSILVLLGMVMKNETYSYNRKLAKLADYIIQSKPLDPYLTIQEAIYLREECLLTKATYFRLRRRLLAHGIILPAEKDYREGSRAMRPHMEHYRHNPLEEAIGVKAKLKPSLELTFKEILETVEKNDPTFREAGDEGDTGRTFNATVKYGLDGSGSHRQIGSSQEMQVISVMFGVSSINELDYLGGDSIWTAADSKGHSSPRNIRPWGYIGAKESYEILEKLVEDLDDEGEEVKAGIDVTTNSGNNYHIRVETAKMTMIDGKVCDTIISIFII